jgi:hypothetical protein
MQPISQAPLALALTLTITGVGAIPSVARADEVTDWNRILSRVTLVTAATPFTAMHHAAIVEPAVFDAVNGIDQRYTPIHVTPAAPTGASARAAAVQAAYATLVALFPTQKAILDANRCGPTCCSA